MTRHKSFKRLVRARMEKTGESYTAARAVILGASETTKTEDPPVLVTSDEGIRKRTGRGWEEWFELLDGWNAAEQTHKEIARRVGGELGIDPLVWEAQAVTVSYERARGRVVGQRVDGFTITASRTVAVPVEQLYDSFLEEDRRAGWLPEATLSLRSATKAKTAHFDWGDDGSRVHVIFVQKGDRSTLTVEHARLVNSAAAEKMKQYWRQGLGRLKTVLEGGENHD